MYRVILVSISLLTVFGLSSGLRAQTRLEPDRIVHADVVALDQLLVYNRFGSFNPFGMIFALRRDVAKADGEAAPSADACGKELGVEPGTGVLKPGEVMLKRCKRPRPLVLRANVGDVLQVNVTNLLRGDWPDFSGQAAGAAENSKSSPADGFPQRSFCEEQKSPPVGPVRRQIRGAVAERPRKVLAGSVSAAKGTTRGTPRKGGAVTGRVLQAASDGSVCLTPAKVKLDQKEKIQDSSDWPRTRTLSLAIPGLEPLPVDGKVHGACTGMDAVMPGDTFTCRWRLDAEGTHLFSSLAAPSGGEGDAGSVGHGLFGALIVEPRESKHYRSQVTHAAFDSAWPKAAANAPKHARDGDAALGYSAKTDVTTPASQVSASNPCRNEKAMPILEMQRPCGSNAFEIVHGDLNGIIVPPLVDDDGKIVKRDGQTVYERRSIDRELAVEGNEDERTNWRLLREKTLPYREFTVIFHDEIKTFYTKNFRDLERFDQFSGIRDGFAINYGASGAGSLVLANRKKIGPAANCPECLYEEFFLESWANGDPALLEAYPDDPSNVHHSYLNDKVVFRNFHAGKETHVFHLHAHQWFAGNDENRGSYLDSQTIGPQQGLTYRIYHGGLDRHMPKEAGAARGWWESLGSGNRNRTIGDSIFHCHLYPHFAQGMWALWRVHDVLEDGTRVLPDGQKTPGLSIGPETNGIGTRSGTDLETGIGNTQADGTPVPGVVPMPGQAAPLLPTYGNTGNPGYPFNIAGTVGHRAPQAPLDMAPTTETQKTATGRDYLDGGLPRHVITHGEQAANIEEKYGPISPDKLVPSMLALGDITAHPKALAIKVLEQTGEPVEKRAMAFHHNGAGLLLFNMFGAQSSHQSGTYDSRVLSVLTGRPSGRGYFAVNGSAPAPGAPFADPCGIPVDLAGRPARAAQAGLPALPALSAQPYRRFDGVSRMVPATFLSSVNDQLRRPEDRSPWLPDPSLTGFRRYEASVVQMNMVVNRAGWHDPQSRINVLTEVSGDWKEVKRSDAQPFFFRAFSGECIEFRHTNETPKDLELDDFQLKVPTDTIGQHIHLVKFDVTSADGSGNGFNYEDGTFAPDEILHRICEAKEVTKTNPSSPGLADRGPECAALKQAKAAKDWKKLKEIAVWRKKFNGDGSDASNRKYFQTTVQRWLADPILSNDGQGGMADRTLRTVFTHDHFAPSNIQQHGFYNALLVEPMGHDVCLMSRPELPGEHGDGKTCKAGPPLLAAANAPMPILAPMTDQKHLVGARASVLLKQAPPGSCKCAASVIADSVSATPTDRVERKSMWNIKTVAAAQQCEPVGDSAAACDSSRDDGRIVWTKGYGNPIHTDAREYAIAIADFATLYDGKAPETLLEKVASSGAKGLDRLVREMRCAFDDKDRQEVPAEYDALLEVPSVAAERCKVLLGPKGQIVKVETNATVLAPAEQDLTEHLKAYRAQFGRAIAPPFRPEAISQKHHDPYLINYRTDPIPLRIGGKKNGDVAPLETARNPCYLPTGDRGRRLERHDDVKYQRPGEAGDMARVFSSNTHGDPCTPILETYDDERVSVRLIQGAQEVQHTLTVAGQTFRRHVDQTFPSAAHRSDERQVISRASQCSSNPVHRDGKPRQAHAWENKLPGWSGPYWSNYKKLIEHCDNPAGTMTAQEIGISEHFELNGSFDGGQTTRAAKLNIARALSNGTTTSTGDLPTDYHYSFGSQDALWNGAWGVIRVYEEYKPEIDWSKCMATKDGTTAAVLGCKGAPEVSIAQRIPSFQELRGAPVTEARMSPAQRTPSLAGAAALATPDTSADDLCQLFEGGSTRAVKRLIVTYRQRDFQPTGVSYRRDVSGSGRLFDPDAIVMRELLWEDLKQFKPDFTSRGTALSPAQRDEIIGKLRLTPSIEEPITLRLRAGDCLQLWTVNLLPEPFAQFQEQQAPAQRDRPATTSWPDADARMPLIVPLNSGAARIRERSKPSEPGDVRTSSSIALAIPLLQLEAVRELGVATGLNDRRPLPTGSYQLRQYYAGVKLNPDLVGPRQKIRVGVDVAPYAFGALAIRALGDVVNHSTRGIIGAVIVESAGNPLPAMAQLEKVSARAAQPSSAQLSSSATIYHPRVEFTGLREMLHNNVVDDRYVLEAASVRSHTLFWQDGLNLWHSRPARAPPFGRELKDFVHNGALPVPDCRVCDDSYDFGEKGVSYRSEPFVRRMAGQPQPPRNGKPVSAPSDLGLTEYPDEAQKADLNGYVFAPKFFSSALRPPATPLLASGKNEQTVIRVVHAGGRARQRAFVLYGANYNDLFPGFGSPHSSLLAPGKSIAAAFCTPEFATGEFMYRDGPQPIFAGGVWGLISVDGTARPELADKCIAIKDTDAPNASASPLPINQRDRYKLRGLP